MNNGLFLSNYHIGEETPDERSFFMDLVAKLHAKYPQLKSKCDAIFDKEGHDYSKREREQIVYRISKSIYRNLLVASDTGEVDINHALRVIKTQLIECLPYYMVNDETFFSDRGFITEPINIYAYYLLNEMQKEITRMEIAGKFEDRAERLVDFTYNNMLRALKSSLVLLSIGDDVHGLATFRGYVELLSRIVLMDNEEAIKLAVEYSDMNTLLQEHKQNDVPDGQMDKKLKGFLVAHNLTKGEAEDFLLRGWAKTPNGKPITKQADMIKYAFGDNAKTYHDVWHQCSEFVHEDYALTNYDFFSIREQYKLNIAQATSFCFQLFQKGLSKMNGKCRTCEELLNRQIGVKGGLNG